MIGLKTIIQNNFFNPNIISFPENYKTRARERERELLITLDVEIKISSYRVGLVQFTLGLNTKILDKKAKKFVPNQWRSYKASTSADQEQVDM